MSPAFASIALIGGLLFTLSGGLGLWATFEFMSSIDHARLDDDDQREALAQAERQMIIASSVSLVLGTSAVIVAFGLFAQRLWAMYSWLVLISLVSLWTVVAGYSNRFVPFYPLRRGGTAPKALCHNAIAISG